MQEREYDKLVGSLDRIQTVSVTGQVHAVRGLTVSVSDFPAPVGAGCRISHSGFGIDSVEGRVIGFNGDQTLVMPLGSTTGICRGDKVEVISNHPVISVGPDMLGRVIDASGRPIDGQGEIQTETDRLLWPDPISPLKRGRISTPFMTGVLAIDTMLTTGKGQRMGIFSGSGVGKSVLLGMLGRNCQADVTVVALIGERGREVRDFIEGQLGPDGLKRSVVVVSTSDESPLMRVQAGASAMSVAEYFRDQGNSVLVLMDSLTRLSMAQRQIGLLAGEPPTTKGYTPSVYNMISGLLERCGKFQSGSITGFYTVLIEGDDMNDPVGDAVRSVTDGHIVLSRRLANLGQFPAIDLLESVSRVMGEVISSDHKTSAAEIRKILALYSEVEDMVNIGAYRPGTAHQYDHAIEAIKHINEFMRQDVEEVSRSSRPGYLLDELCEKIQADLEVTI